jgi:hypothetical protein
MRTPHTSCVIRRPVHGLCPSRPPGGTLYVRAQRYTVQLATTRSPKGPCGATLWLRLDPPAGSSNPSSSSQARSTVKPAGRQSGPARARTGARQMRAQMHGMWAAVAGGWGEHACTLSAAARRARVVAGLLGNALVSFRSRGSSGELPAQVRLSIRGAQTGFATGTSSPPSGVIRIAPSPVT